ncbi:hypothetical protein UF14_04520 [Bacillus licheniformis]|nr:hypothetical protein UF14_04520 [Bacillus licheniformis]
MKKLNCNCFPYCIAWTRFNQRSRLPRRKYPNSRLSNITCLKRSGLIKQKYNSKRAAITAVFFMISVFLVT